MPDYRSWLEKGLGKDGVTADRLADELGLHRSAIYKMLYGERKFKEDEIPIIAKIIKEAAPVAVPKKLKRVVVLPIESIVSASWNKPQKIRGAKTVYLRNPNDGDGDLVAFRVDGECPEGGKIVTGDDLICETTKDSGFPEGSLVVARSGANISLQKIEKHHGKPFLSAITGNKELTELGDDATVIAVAVHLNRPL